MNGHGLPDEIAGMLRSWTLAVAVTERVGADHPLLFANPAFEELTGYRSDELAGADLRCLQGPSPDPVPCEGLRTALAAGRSHAACLLNYRRNGEPFANLLLVEPVRLGADGAPLVMGFLHEVELDLLDHLDTDRIAEIARRVERLLAAGPATVTEHLATRFLAASAMQHLVASMTVH